MLNICEQLEATPRSVKQCSAALSSHAQQCATERSLAQVLSSVLSCRGDIWADVQRSENKMEHLYAALSSQQTHVHGLKQL
eukprot:3626409-Alexandrium_andersonii.AAC.1